MIIIWGFGKKTKKFIGGVFQRTCNYCNQTSIWQLCVVRTWFTLFYIPIIPYKKMYCIICPNCSSYIELSKEQFEKIRFDLNNAQSQGDVAYSVEDQLKYQGKTEAQINYLKEMEEARKSQVDKDWVKYIFLHKVWGSKTWWLLWFMKVLIPKLSL